MQRPQFPFFALLSSAADASPHHPHSPPSSYVLLTPQRRSIAPSPYRIPSSILWPHRPRLRAVRHAAARMHRLHVRILYHFFSPLCASSSAGDIYLPSGVDQSFISANVSTRLSRVQLLPPDCRTSITKMICSIAFQLCAPTDSLPVPVCPSVCAEAVGNCSGTLAYTTVANCATFNDSLGELVFENGILLQLVHAT